MATETEKISTYMIFVGNIPTRATNEELRQIFQEFGTVVDFECLGNKGFVHMEDDIEGKHAIGQLQGRTLLGHTLKIAKSTKPGAPRIPAVKLFVKNVSSTVDARGLRNMFKRFGYVLGVELTAGSGHVCLEATGDIKSAIKEMNGHVIDEVAMSVEPGPVIPPPGAPTPAPKKKFKPSTYSGGNNWDNPWQSQGPGPSAYHHEEYDYGDDYDYDNSYPPEPNPFEPNPFEASKPFCPEPEPFEPPPERILRDPHAHSFENNGFGRSRGGRAPRFRGRGRGVPPPPFMSSFAQPPARLLPPMHPPRGMRGMGMRMRARIGRGGGPPRPTFDPPPFVEQHQHIPRDRMNMQAHQTNYNEEEEVFYEDEPLPTPASLLRMSLSGANAVPVGFGCGDEGLVSRTPAPRPNRARGGNSFRRGMGRGFGRGKSQRFTALTDEISPGEKYPVPPMVNPSWRAPLKWPKEEVKRKIKKKKQPLVPAELPDYSIPVPDLPRPSVPRGAVLKPFPAPMGMQHGSRMSISQIGYSLSNGASSSSANTQMDFTMDEVV